jgi:hypothetical protein
MKDAIRFATGVIISGARFLKPNPEDRTKATTSVVISLSPDQASHLSDSIRLFSRPRKCEKMFSSSPIKQCRNCNKFGHPSQLCKQELPSCSICASNHTRNDHRCGNEGCVKGGNTKPTPGCCDTVAMRCFNCSGEHTANYPQCPTKLAASASLNARINRTTSSSTPAPLSASEDDTMADGVALV